MKRQAEQRLAAEGAWSDPDWVFSTTAGGRLYPPDITKTFHQLTDEAGVPRIRIQDVRHTHATLLLKAHENIKVVSERLGHSTTALTMDTYAALSRGCSATPRAASANACSKLCLLMIVTMRSRSRTDHPRFMHSSS